METERQRKLSLMCPEKALGKQEGASELGLEKKQRRDEGNDNPDGGNDMSQR